MQKKSKKRRTPRINAHMESHKEIEAKLNYILTEVSANGNPGLDRSLKDLYQGQKDIKGKLDEIYEIIKPDLDRAAWWRATKKMMQSSRFYRFHSTKFGFLVLLFMIFSGTWLIAGSPVVSTVSTLLPAIYAVFKDVLK